MTAPDFEPVQVCTSMSCKIKKLIRVRQTLSVYETSPSAGQQKKQIESSGFCAPSPFCSYLSLNYLAF